MNIIVAVIVIVVVVDATKIIISGFITHLNDTLYQFSNISNIVTHILYSIV